MKLTKTQKKAMRAQLLHVLADQMRTQELAYTVLRGGIQMPWGRWTPWEDSADHNVDDMLRHMEQEALAVYRLLARGHIR